MEFFTSHVLSNLCIYLMLYPRFAVEDSSKSEFPGAEERGLDRVSVQLQAPA